MVKHRTSTNKNVLAPHGNKATEKGPIPVPHYFQDPPLRIKELMGHSSILTSMDYYIQDVDENKKQAIKQLDRMMEE